MEEYLLDTDVLIWYLRGKEEIVEVLCNLSKIGRIYTSVISRTEVMIGMKPNEETETKNFLSSLGSCIINDSIADLAGEYIRNYRKIGVTLEIPDALIAATVTLNNLVLVTLNSKHYPMKGIKMYFGRD